MVRQIFKNKVIASAGPLPGQFTVDNLKKWTRIRRGTFTEEFSSDVTHLLCTHEQFRSRGSRVREALRMGKKFHIVHYDWFEFSTVNNRKEPEREYSMLRIIAAQNALRREAERREKGIREGEKAVNTNYYHVYQDAEHFYYQISIKRDEETLGQDGQRYIMTIYESNAKPHLYWFVAKFLKKRGDSQPTFHRPSPCSSLLEEQLRYFTEFFFIKTGIEWKDRVSRYMTCPPTRFLYVPPMGGKPVGVGLRFSYEYCLKVNAELRGLARESPAVDERLEQKPESGSATPATADNKPEAFTG